MRDGPFWRAYPTTFERTVIERTGQHELSGRLVPYNVSADVVDVRDGQYELYREGFRPGAFAPQAQSTSKGIIAKIGLVHRHEGGLGYLGPFVGLRDEPDGLYGAVRIMPTLAENVATLLDAGVDELSVEFRLPRGENTVVDSDGVRWRVKAHLDQVALEPKGAYTGASVLAFRAEQDDLLRARADADAEEAARKQVEEQERLAAEAAEAAVAAEAQAAEERRRAFDEMAGRYDDAQRRQEEMVREYGVTRPGGLGSMHR